VYEWTRKSQRGKKRWVPSPNRPGWGRHVRDYDDIPVRMEVPIGEVFNVSAYTPGDYRQFFEDPRTRRDYLQWAPILLAAEEYHAGRKGGVPVRFCTSCDHRHEFGETCATTREDGATCCCNGHSGPKWFVSPPPSDDDEQQIDSGEQEDE
jgi:hypothetical protein